MSFTRRKKYVYWSALIQEWEDSDQTQFDFCAEKNVKLGTFCKWRQRFKKQPQQKKETNVGTDAHFVEATLFDSQNCHHDNIVLYLKQGVQMHIPSHLTQETLEQLLMALGVVV